MSTTARSGEQAVHSSTLLLESQHEWIALKRAEEIMGGDFFGEKAVRALETKLQAAGINVRFVTDSIPFTYSDKQLGETEKEKGTQRERKLFLRPKKMLVYKNDEWHEVDITVLNLYYYLRGIKYPFENPQKGGQGRDTRQIIDYGRYSDADSFIEPLEAGYALVTKNILFAEPNVAVKQNELLLPDERKRTLIEIVWDRILEQATKDLPVPADEKGVWELSGSSIDIGIETPMIACVTHGSRGLIAMDWVGENKVHYPPPKGIRPTR